MQPTKTKIEENVQQEELNIEMPESVKAEKQSNLEDGRISKFHFDRMLLCETQCKQFTILSYTLTLFYVSQALTYRASSTSTS